MKPIIFLLCALFPYNLTGQSLLNVCQSKHMSHSKVPATAAVATDYDVVHYDLYVDSISFGQSELQCRAGLSIAAQLANVSTVNLDLLGFTIDSITGSGYSITHTYNDTTISMQFTPAITQGNTAQIMIYYHGSPAMDASGWGGFYFNGNFAFNLGVGFFADPHNFGRAWFPTIDNFVSRGTYDFYIRTLSSQKAFCNGTLQQATTNPDGTVTWHWSMNQTIPSYLASIAVAPYYTLERTSNGIPVEWAALPADTPNVLATFSNLDVVLGAFIDAYGPYPFDKVGYCLVPFNQGAMEHATSIHIGQVFVNGSQSYSTLWAHELSHMWWGDKVTCETAEDMWLNEGFATYNEAFYHEVVNGATAYRDWIRSNHRKVLQLAHTQSYDESYLALNAIPHEFTYGYHVYQKGADVVHTLRNYMGDSAFFSGCQAYMTNQAYSHANSLELRDELTNATGINMNRFFDDWIITEGFPHFSIDSVIYVPGGLDHMFVYTRQRTKGNNNHLYEMPIELNFSNGTIDTSVTVVIDSLTNLFHIPLYFMPTWTTLDRFEKVSHAVVSNEKDISVTGNVTMPETNTLLNVQSLGSTTTTVRMMHHFVPPDPYIGVNPGIRLSDYHYWSAEGLFDPGFVTSANFIYDGSTSPTTGYLDNTFITGNEDSLVILYRPGPGTDWQVVPSFVHNIGTTTDKKGSFTVDTLLIGEYTLGMYDYMVGLHEQGATPDKMLEASPNPSGDTFSIKYKCKSSGSCDLIIFDLGGRQVCDFRNLTKDESITWNASRHPSGIYQAVLLQNGKKISGINLVLNR